MEKVLLSAKYNVRGLYNYAEKVIRGPWPEAETFLEKDTLVAYDYATKILKDRFPAGEPAIKQSDSHWNQYKEKFGLTNNN